MSSVSVARGTASAPTAGSAAKTAFARWQFWLILTLLGAFTAVAVQLLSSGTSARYGLDSTQLDGYGAMAEVLDDHGVTIHTSGTAEHTAALMDRHPDAQVVVMAEATSQDTFAPTPDLVEQLREATEQGREVLWISSNPSTLSDAIGDPALEPAGSVPDDGSAGPAVLASGSQCPLEAAQVASEIKATASTLLADYGCFSQVSDAADSDAADSDVENAGAEGAGYVLAESRAGWVLTAPEIFTNRHITESGHAALALGYFSAHDDAETQPVIWHTLSGADALSAGDWASPMDYLPDWALPLAWWLAGCTVIAMIVAGRRHGPVVTEPLPVSVPAHEVAHGRGRLYQRAGAVQQASRILRAALLVRLSRHLRLGRTPEISVIADAVARQTGDPEAEVLQVLTRQPASHQDLVTTARAWAQLERRVKDVIR